MIAHQSLVFLHILLFVFWLGTDVGVFIAGFWFLNPTLSLEQRNTSMALAMVIDRFPRICFVAIMPVGLELARQMAVLPISLSAMGAVLLLDLLWLATVVIPMVKPATPLAKRARTVELMFQINGLLVFAGGGLALLLGGSAPLWLAGKLFAYGAICLFAILLDRAFGPVVIVFGRIAAEGSAPFLEAQLRRAMAWTYVWVVAVYAGQLVAGYLGVTKL